MTTNLAGWQTGDTHLRSPLAMRQYNEMADRVASDRPGRILLLMLQILADISANRMPSVANLLKGGAKAPRVAAASTPGSNTKAVGQSKDQPNPAGGAKETKRAANSVDPSPRP